MHVWRTRCGSRSRRVPPPSTRHTSKRPSSELANNVCKLLCWEQGELDRAEVKYNQSPTNLLRHLNIGYPEHQETYKVCMNHKAGKKNGLAAGGSASGSTSTGQQEIGLRFRPNTSPAWHQELARWMVTRTTFPYR